MKTTYSKLFAGSFIVAQRIIQNLKEQGISPIVKDENRISKACWLWHIYLRTSGVVCKCL